MEARDKLQYSFASRSLSSLNHIEGVNTLKAFKGAVPLDALKKA